MKQHVWLWYLAAVVFVGQYYFVSSVSSTPNSDLYTAISASGLLAVIAGLVIHRPRQWAGWALVAGSVGLYLAGDYVYASLQDDNPFVAFPSTADWIYLAMYPMLIVGLVMIRRSRSVSAGRAALADAAIVGAVTFAVIGVLYMNSYLVDDTFGRQAQIVAAAYPVLDVVLVGATAWLVFAAARPAAAEVMLACAAIAIVVGNAVFNAESLSFAFAPGGIADLGWLGFTSVLGAAALHPSMADERALADAETSGMRPTPLWAYITALAAIPVAHARWGSSDDLKFTVPAGLIAVALVGYRHANVRSPQPSATSAIATA